VTDGTTISSAAKETEHQYGHLDILVNNAGITGCRVAAGQ
jgi:NAD(P)-dependent dehydrogenase (short-subunit alcohol dehydrogenase family)